MTRTAGLPGPEQTAVVGVPGHEDIGFLDAGGTGQGGLVGFAEAEGRCAREETGHIAAARAVEGNTPSRRVIHTPGRTDPEQAAVPGVLGHEDVVAAKAGQYGFAGSAGEKVVVPLKPPVT